MMKLFLLLGADVNARSNGNTPLILASIGGHVNAIQLLITHKADPFLQNFSGHTALTIAARNKQMDIVNLLSEYQTSLERMRQ